MGAGADGCSASCTLPLRAVHEHVHEQPLFMNVRLCSFTKFAVCDLPVHEQPLFMNVHEPVRL